MISCNSATFWSGKGNCELAENFSISAGKITLEQTTGGKYLESLDLFKQFPYTQAIKPWEILSLRYAQAASGEVYAFVNNSLPFSIFNRIELPALKVNSNISNITYLSEGLEYLNRYKL